MCHSPYRKRWQHHHLLPVLLGFLKWVSNPLILLVVAATNLTHRPHGMTLLVNKGNLRDQVRSWDIRVV